MSEGVPLPGDAAEALRRELAEVKAALEGLRFHVSHDLRAPLRHIRAFVQVIEEDHAPGLEPPVLAHLKTIQQSADKAMELLDALVATPEGATPLRR
jgi:light-regulated signal transduction histidine kinase (bacteriophytochrome)